MTQITKTIPEGAVDPMKRDWGSATTFVPTTASLYSNASSRGWGVVVSGPVLTKNGTLHKTRRAERNFGPGRPGTSANRLLPDGTSALRLFTAEEIQAFMRAIRDDLERHAANSAAICVALADEWEGLAPRKLPERLSDLGKLV